MNEGLIRRVRPMRRRPLSHKSPIFPLALRLVSKSFNFVTAKVFCMIRTLLNDRFGRYPAGSGRRTRMAAFPGNKRSQIRP
jgi:hypothetical protein